MPCLELKVTAQPLPQPATHLRALLERPGAAVLRRHRLAEAPGFDSSLHDRLRVAAVLALDLTDVPQEAASLTGESSDGSGTSERPDPLTDGLAKGVEIWVSDGERAACAFADLDEIPSLLGVSDGWQRLTGFAPAVERIEERGLGLQIRLREGLSVGIQGDPCSEDVAGSLARLAAIPEIEDFREGRFVVRLPEEGIGLFHSLLRSAAAWLSENSSPSLLGAR